MSNGTSVECGEGGTKTRTRWKILNGELSREVEEAACPSCVEFNDVCLNYNELNSPKRRSTNSKPNDIDNCDQLINFKGKENRDKSIDWKGSGWYRITGEAGTKLVDSKVGEKHCGTGASGWMDGGHPTVAEGEVERTVYFRWSSQLHNWTASVKVLNCKTHYVYHLVDTPNCDLGYCTEC